MFTKSAISRATITLLIALIFFSSFAYGDQAKVKVNGLKGDIKSNVTERLKIDLDTDNNDLSPQQIRDHYQDTTEAVKKAMAPFGYFDPIIQSKLTRNDKIWTASFTIDRGTPNIIKNITIKLQGPGKNNPAFKHLISHFPIKAGQTLNINQYKDAKTEIFTTAQNIGYIKGNLASESIEVDTENHTSTINLVFNTGKQYFFGKVNFINNPFNKTFSGRLNMIKEGRPYNTQEVLNFQQNLNQSHYFSHVSVNPDSSNTQNYQVPINVSLTPGNPQKYIFGLGYGTYTGIRTSAGIIFKRVNKYGHHFDANLTLSHIQSGLTAQYYIPGSNPFNQQYIIGSQIQYQKPNDGVSNYQNIYVAKANTHKKWQQTYQITLQEEKYKVVDEDPWTSSTVIMPSILFSRINTDDITSPTRGYKFSTSIRGASNDYGSTVTFGQLLLQNKILFPLTSSNLALFRSSLGFTNTPDIDEVPLSLRYYAGGINSLRGYGYKDIGPGKYLKSASIELQHRVYNDTYISLFFDTATAADIFNTSLEKSWGPAFIWKSPVGAVQFGFAKTITKTDNPWSFFISIGPEL